MCSFVRSFVRLFVCPLVCWIVYFCICLFAALFARLLACLCVFEFVGVRDFIASAWSRAVVRVLASGCAKGLARCSFACFLVLGLCCRGSHLWMQGLSNNHKPSLA